MAGSKASKVPDEPSPENFEEQSFTEDEVSESHEEFEPYIEWVGSVGHREVTTEQWKEAGIEDQETVVWTRDQPRVLLSALTPAASERLMAEPNFKFVNEPPKEDD